MSITPKKSFTSPKTPQNSSEPNENSGGRFIPNRGSSDFVQILEKAEHIHYTPNLDPSIDNQPGTFSDLVQKQLFGNDITNHQNRTNILRYKTNSAIQQHKENYPLSPLNMPNSSHYTSRRKISKIPYKVLDAPSLQDDFYLNLIDWSKNQNLAVGLDNSVYLWSSVTGQVSHLSDIPNDNVASVSWSPLSNHLAVGSKGGMIHLFDAVTQQSICQYTEHKSRVGVLAWNGCILTSGSNDSSIVHRDLRLPTPCIASLQGHKQEVCGLKWSFDGNQFATGGNDNKLILWNFHSNQPVSVFDQHQAAIKAIAWSPHQHGLLVSGGGSADRTIRMWNSLTCNEIACYDTQSQVCNLIFSQNSNELVSTHGYSQNQVIVWKYPTMQTLGILLGHSSRVLYLALSPDSQDIVTGAGDETLRFWHVFEQNEQRDMRSSLDLSIGNLR